MRSLSRLAAIAALLVCAGALPAQTPKTQSDDPTIKKSSGAPPSKMSPDPSSKVPRAIVEDGARSVRRALPPELVMEHQNELGLSEAERQVLRQSVQQAQARFTDLQWRLSAETERLDTILREPVLREAQVLEQVDRVLALERDLKRTKIALLVRIKNTLTPDQQAKLAGMRMRKQ